MMAWAGCKNQPRLRKQEPGERMPEIYTASRKSRVSPFIVVITFLLTMCSAISSSAQDRLREIGTAMAAWTALDELAKVCSNFPDEQGRLDRLEEVTVSTYQYSVKQRISNLNRNSSWRNRVETDVQKVVRANGGCDTDAMLEWQAEGRRQIDIDTQWFSVPDGSVVVHWPSPALLVPIHVSVEGLGHGSDGHTYLKVLLRNDSKDIVGVALAGKDLRDGLCTDLTSAELPTTGQSYRATKLARVAPGESMRVQLKLGTDCFESDDSDLMGTLVIETKSGVEYRAIAVLGIQG
ncbi:hypothethical protein (plasmid) [Ralstonia solanacearum CMR15]|nr:hypothethical protein [Ralstonia solanacearum CMR15]